MSYVPVDLRRRIVALSGGCCEYCRVSQTAGTVIYHIEHIIALSHGGQTSENNLALSCSRCNLYKGVNIAAADPDVIDPNQFPRKCCYSKMAKKLLASKAASERLSS